MNLRFVVLLLLISNIESHAQEFAGYEIIDYLRNVVHPTCDLGTNKYITGPPNDSMWVNLETIETISGDFGFGWTNGPGPELIIHSAFNKDRYDVRLILNNGSFSESHRVEIADWINLEGNVPWT